VTEAVELETYDNDLHSQSLPSVNPRVHNNLTYFNVQCHWSHMGIIVQVASSSLFLIPSDQLL